MGHLFLSQVSGDPENDSSLTKVTLFLFLFLFPFRVVEKALSLLPYRDQLVTTPLDLETLGKALDVSSVSVLRRNRVGADDE